MPKDRNKNVSRTVRLSISPKRDVKDNNPYIWSSAFFCPLRGQLSVRWFCQSERDCFDLLSRRVSVARVFFFIEVKPDKVFRHNRMICNAEL